MANKIKNCPFCGGSARLDMNQNSKTGAWFVYARCNGCGATGHTIYLGSLGTREDWDDANNVLDDVVRRAANAWNRRDG